MKTLRIFSMLILLCVCPALALAGAPVASSFSTTVPYNRESIVQLQGSDPDATPLTFAIASQPSHGSLSALNTSTGSVIYTPAVNYTGADSFTFTVTSGGDTTSAATVTLSVTNAKTRIIDSLTNTAGAPLQGKVTFILTQAVTTPAGLSPVGSSVSAVLDSNGRFDVSLFPSRTLQPNAYYQVWFSETGTTKQSLIGVYDIPASSVSIVLSPYKVMDTALAARYTFASEAGVSALTQAAASATLQTLLGVNPATGALLKWNGSAIANSLVSESGSTVTTTGNSAVTGNSTVGGNQTVTGTMTAGGFSGINNAALPSTITGKTINNTTVTGTFAGLTSDMLPSTLANKSFTNATANGLTSSSATLHSPLIDGSPVISGATWSGNQNFPGNITASGTITAPAFVGSGAGLTGIGSGTGGVINTGSTTVGAGTATTGIIDLQTQTISRMNIGYAGRVGIGIPGDTGAIGFRAMLNLKGFNGQTAPLKFWTSDTSSPVSANFAFISGEYLTSGTRKNVQYGWGFNLQAGGGKEFENEANLAYNMETFWNDGPSAPAVEHYLGATGRNGSGAQRLFMYYLPQDNPLLWQLEWAINTIIFEDVVDREAWMSFTPGHINLVESTHGGHPSIVGPQVGEPLVFQGTYALPFVNSDARMELARDTQSVVFMGNHDLIDPSSDYRFILGNDTLSDGLPRPELRYSYQAGSDGFQFSNDGTTFVNLSDGTKGETRKSYSLGGTTGSYSLLGSAPHVADNTPLTAQITLTEGNLDNPGNTASRAFWVMLPTFGTSNTWKEVLPAYKDAGTDYGLRLDVKTDGDNNVVFRLRRAVNSDASAATTVYADVKIFGASGGAFATSTTTGTGASVVGALELITTASRVVTTLVDYGDGVFDTKGAGSPEGVVTASPGSTYRRTDCTTTTTCLYMKTGSGFNTDGWTAK